MVTKKVKIKLQGHEKFALREGWINKALMILPENPDAFTRKDATDLFGIGSNMVKSLGLCILLFQRTLKMLPHGSCFLIDAMLTIWKKMKLKTSY